jgi:hypothetical protein
VAGELYPSRSIDGSMMHPPARTLTPNFDIAIPFPKSAVISCATAPSAGFTPANVRVARFFSLGPLSQFFKTLEDDFDVTFPADARTQIYHQLLEQMANVVRGAVQESRRQTNFYTHDRAPTDWDVTSCPWHSHHYITTELYFSNFIRRAQIAPTEDYDPHFYVTFDQASSQLFHGQDGPEVFEQRQQIVKICQSLKHRGIMFKTVAKEKDGPSYNEKVEDLCSNYKAQQGPKAAGASQRAAEVFGRREAQEKRLANRVVTVKHVMTFLQEWVKTVSINLTEVLLTRYEAEQ